MCTLWRCTICTMCTLWRCTILTCRHLSAFGIATAKSVLNLLKENPKKPNNWTKEYICICICHSTMWSIHKFAGLFVIVFVFQSLGDSNHSVTPQLRHVHLWQPCVIVTVFVFAFLFVFVFVTVCLFVFQSLGLKSQCHATTPSCSTVTALCYSVIVAKNSAILVSVLVFGLNGTVLQ